MDVSPLSSQAQFDTVSGYIGIGAAEGADLVYGGIPLSGGIYDEGYYVEPTIFAKVDPSMRIAQEEIFRPFLMVFKATHLDEAVTISNSVKFGLSSSVYTRDLTQAFDLCEQDRRRHGPHQLSDAGRRGPPALWRAQVIGR